MLNTLILTRLTQKKLHNLQNRQVYVQENNRDDDTCAPGINISRIAQNKNLTYFAVGFSVISLTISKPLLEIRLESMQQTELRLKCLIIIGRSKVSPIVSPEKTAQVMSRSTWEFKTSLPELDMIVHKMKSFDYKNPKITDLRSSTDHFSVVRNTNIQFLCEMCRSHVFLLFVICISIRFFFSASNWTLCSIFYASKRKTSASQDAMTHSGYISTF